MTYLTEAVLEHNRILTFLVDHLTKLSEQVEHLERLHNTETVEKAETTQENVYYQGDRFVLDGTDTYIVANCGDGFMLISLEDGNRYVNEKSPYPESVKTYTLSDKMFAKERNRFVRTYSNKAQFDSQDEVHNPGVYIIQNTVNGKRYVGYSEQNVFTALNDNLTMLQWGIHPNHHLQNSYNLYGSDCFYGWVSNQQSGDVVADYNATVETQAAYYTLYNY